MRSGTRTVHVIVHVYGADESVRMVPWHGSSFRSIVNAAKVAYSNAKRIEYGKSWNTMSYGAH